MSSDNCECRCRVCDGLISIGASFSPISDYYRTCKKCRDAATQTTQMAYTDLSVIKKLLEDIGEHLRGIIPKEKDQ